MLFVCFQNTCTLLVWKNTWFLASTCTRSTWTCKYEKYFNLAQVLLKVLDSNPDLYIFISTKVVWKINQLTNNKGMKKNEMHWFLIICNFLSCIKQVWNIIHQNMIFKFLLVFPRTLVIQTNWFNLCIFILAVSFLSYAVSYLVSYKCEISFIKIWSLSVGLYSPERNSNKLI